MYCELLPRGATIYTTNSVIDIIKPCEIPLLLTHQIPTPPPFPLRLLNPLTVLSCCLIPPSSTTSVRDPTPVHHHYSVKVANLASFARLVVVILHASPDLCFITIVCVYVIVSLNFCRG